MKLTTDDGETVAKVTFDPFQIDVLNEQRTPDVFVTMDDAESVEFDLPEGDDTATERRVNATSTEKKQRTKALAASYDLTTQP